MPIIVPRKNDVVTQPYQARPPRSDSMSGRIVMTASDSKATSVTTETRPTRSARRSLIAVVPLASAGTVRRQLRLRSSIMSGAARTHCRHALSYRPMAARSSRRLRRAEPERPGLIADTRSATGPWPLDPPGGADARSRSGQAREARCILVIDGNNVIGAVADGWWRDRPAAVRRLLARLQCLGPQLGEPLLLVVDVAQADLPEGDHGGVTVRYASRRGRNAADDRIRELVTAGATVVTSDRALRRDLEADGCSVVGAGTFLARLDAAGC